jgi:hypothetical protein
LKLGRLIPEDPAGIADDGCPPDMPLAPGLETEDEELESPLIEALDAPVAPPRLVGDLPDELAGVPPKPSGEEEPDAGDPPPTIDASEGGIPPEMDGADPVVVLEPWGGLDPGSGCPAAVRGEDPGRLPPPVDQDPVEPLVDSEPDATPPDPVARHGSVVEGEPGAPGASPPPGAGKAPSDIEPEPRPPCPAGPAPGV